ncbi:MULTISPECIES: fumarylacetoacetate hydrolase family protein [Rhodococcus]|uniref:Fumarylacetoacetate hydrolase family protein n=1 Tax=Rhodococcus wratislaviensis NBRC 100605 TaxID=1219028 RepID=X0Q8H6_RHOWR|nr:MULTISPECIES: fumarylacetoacetate hydrolase family protein [Rhodococcus]WAM19091.1 fumarylacetoacetate hydrolase family protein [Rhodococcus sp. JS3073]GAF47166.1 fumarylacetoacetate hydrolase family protein [Rhodococcus wratislaviensis NBRC 100605]
MKIGRATTPAGTTFVGIDPQARQHQVREIAGTPFGEVSFTGNSWGLNDVELLAPVTPSKVLCIGKNYADHAAEMGAEAPADPVIFMKPSTAVIASGQPIMLPRSATEVHYEGELAVVIGAPAFQVPAEDALKYVFGYTIGNDVVSRDQQRHDGQWTRGKGHDTFCPLGPWIETDLDASSLSIVTTVDGQVRQDSSTSLLLHTIPRIIEWISEAMTLLPGDVILTGTPKGVGELSPGQRVQVTVEGIGTLDNPVVSGHR